MTRSRRALLAVGLALTLTGLGLFIGAPRGNAAGVEFGWWWKGNPGQQVPVPGGVPVPAQNFPADPPSAPEPPNAAGGLMVGALPDGAFAVAAVRAPLNATSLTLTVAPNGDAGGQVAHLLACAATSPWNPIAAGRWDDKPIVACDLVNGGGSVAGIRSEDGTTWTFPVAPLASDGAVDVVIVPAADPTVPAGAAEPFQLVFQPPTESSFAVGPPLSTGGEFPQSSDPSTDLTTSDDVSPTIDFGAFGGSTTPVAAPALSSNDQAPVLAAVPAAADADDDGAAKALGLLVMLLGLAAILAATRQPTPAIRSLTRMGATEAAPATTKAMGGLGRFAAEREGRPPPLF